MLTLTLIDHSSGELSPSRYQLAAALAVLASQSPANAPAVKKPQPDLSSIFPST